MKNILLLTLLTNILFSVNSTYFLLNKNSQKCLYEEFYNNTIIIMRFNLMDDIHDVNDSHLPLFDFYLYDVSKDDKRIENYQSEHSSGRINFIILESSSYKLCIIPQRDTYIYEKTDSVKMSVTFQPFDGKKYEKELDNTPKNKDIDLVKERVENMQKKLVDIMKTQMYQIDKEDKFSVSKQDNSSMLVYLTFIQITILLVLTIWQVVSFKDLFKDKINF